jgi:antitoxin MazE
MKTKIMKWGNSHGIRIPSSIMKSKNISVNEELEVRECAEGLLIVIPKPRERINLDALLDSITPEMLHEEADFGPAEGNEIW